MDLFVVRHAVAVPWSSELDDRSRPLTDKGRARFRRCVKGLEVLGVRFDRLLHSPLLRAVQTAEELAQLLDGESVVTPHLAAPPAPALLAELAGAESPALVGHEPWVSALTAALLGAGDGTAVAFKKGAVAWLQGDPEPRAMQLVAFLPPRVLVELA